MRWIGCLVLLAFVVPDGSGQIKEERRLGVRHNPELYPQDTPRRALGSLLQAIDKERYDYVLAFLMDQGYVQEQLQITARHYANKAREQVDGERLDAKGFDQAFIRNRTRELAEQMNFENLVRRLRTKLSDDPEALKELRKLFREGTIADMADTATVQHPEVKDHKLFLRLVDKRWYIDNKMQE